MFLSAQRVRSPGGQEGVNAFYYAHEELDWSGLPPEGVPDENPGRLVQPLIQVPPPGNRVLSFLDVVAPDRTSPEEIRTAFIAFVADAQGRDLPWTGIEGSVFFRLSMEASFAEHWQREAADLFRAVQQVRNI